jgi:hypothetical protein
MKLAATHSGNHRLHHLQKKKSGVALTWTAELSALAAVERTLALFTIFSAGQAAGASTAPTSGVPAVGDAESLHDTGNAPMQAARRTRR